MLVSIAIFFILSLLFIIRDPTIIAIQFKSSIRFSTLRRYKPFSLLPRKLLAWNAWNDHMTNLLPIDHIRLDGNQWLLFFIQVLIIFFTHINMPFASNRLKGFKTYFWDHKQANRNYSPSCFCILIDNHDFLFKFITIGHAYVHKISFLDFLRLVSTIWGHEVLPTICYSTSQIAVLFLVFANSVILLRYAYRYTMH